MSILDDPEDCTEAWDVPDEWTSDAVAEVASLEEVTRMARRLARLEAEQAQEDALVEAEIDRLQQRAVESARRRSHRLEYLRSHLKAYALWRRKVTGGVEKTTHLLYATIETRPSGGSWKAGPEAVSWALFHAPELVETRPAFKIADGKRRPGWKVDGDRVLDTTTGEIIPGITVEPTSINATVKAAGGGA